MRRGGTEPITRSKRPLVFKVVLGILVMIGAIRILRRDSVYVGSNGPDRRRGTTDDVVTGTPWR